MGDGVKRSLWVCGALLCVGYVWAQKTAAPASKPAVAAPLPDAQQVHQMQAQLEDWPNLARYRAENEALPPVRADEQRVVFFGDSITDGWGRSGATGAFF